ncbi:MAG: TerC/Alx family metal homeostasis membrane protein [Zoogloeaceae bacterium]|jgi:tellurite resistance protein TerC|nr:TerC/Alx family metal homeostasis membrane protein [Zoogloeaceae bacterium]
MEHFGFPLETIVIFFVVIFASVYLDLVAHKNVKEITLGDAAKWAVFWIGLALCFYAYVWLRFSKDWADLYLAGYVLEKSLSVDNLVVFIAIFVSFGIKSHLQHRILYWGILGALVFRAIFVKIGTALFLASPWVGFIFAVVVFWSAIQMLKSGDDEEEIEDYSNHRSVRWTGKLLPIYTRLHFERFFVKHKEILGNDSGAENKIVTRSGILYATPAFLCLMVIETSDIAFSFDSVPAVISVTQEPLLVYAAMIFAILGLRTLYFVIAALNRYLAHLEKAVIALLFFIAAKIALQSWNNMARWSAPEDWRWPPFSSVARFFNQHIKPVFIDTGFDISPGQSLTVIVSVLLIGMIASVIFPEKREAA